MLSQQPVGLLSLSPGDEKSSPGYTHSHTAQLGQLFPVSRNQASSCTISVHWHHPAWPGNVGFSPLLKFSFGDWSTGVSDETTPGRFHWGIPGSKDVFFKGAFAEWDPAKHASTSKPAFCSTHSYKDLSWTGDTQWLELQHYWETQNVALYNQAYQCPPSSAFPTRSWRRDDHTPIHKELFHALSCLP